MKKIVSLTIALMLLLLTACNSPSESSIAETESSLVKPNKSESATSEIEEEWIITETEGNTKKVYEYSNYGNDWKLTTEKYKGEIVISRTVAVVENKKSVRTEEYIFDDEGNLIKKDIEGKSEDGEGKTNIHEYIEDGIRHSYTTIYDGEDNKILDEAVFSYFDGDGMIQERCTSTVIYLESECTKREIVYYKDGEKLGSIIEYNEFDNGEITSAKTFLDAYGNKTYDEVIYSDGSVYSYVYLDDIVYLAEEKNKTDYKIYIFEGSGEEKHVCDATYDLSTNKFTAVVAATDFSNDEVINIINEFFTAINDILTHLSDHDKAPIL